MHVLERVDQAMAKKRLATPTPPPEPEDEGDDEAKTRPARIGTEAQRLAKVAAGIRGVSAAKYMTMVIIEAANRDIEEWYETRKGGK